MSNVVLYLLKNFVLLLKTIYKPCKNIQNKNLAVTVARPTII